MVNHYIHRIADKYIAIWLIFGTLFVLLGLTVVGIVYLDYNPTQTQQITDVETEEFRLSMSTESSAVRSNNVFNESDTISGPIHQYGPNATLSVVQEFESDRPVAANNTVYVVINGTEQGWSFWNERFIVRDQSIEMNGSYTSRTDINVSKYRNRAVNVRQAYDSQGTISVNIVAETDYKSEYYRGTLSNSTLFTFRENTYSVIPPEFTESRPHTVRTVVGTQETGDEMYMNAGLAFVGIGILLIIFRFAAADPKRVKKDYIMMQFSEWISVADPEKTSISEQKNKICLQSVEDMIDVAADSRTRVIWVESEKQIFVIDENTKYVYNLTEDDMEPVRSEFVENIRSKYGRTDDSTDEPDDEEDNEGMFKFID